MYRIHIYVHHRPNYINFDIIYDSRVPMYQHHPTSMTRDLVPTSPTSALYTTYIVSCNYLLSISCTTWRWPLSSAETCSCTLCVKNIYFSTIKYICVKQVHTLHSTFWRNLLHFRGISAQEEAEGTWDMLLPSNQTARLHVPEDLPNAPSYHKLDFACIG